MTTAENPEYALAFSYAPPRRRPALIALFALDAALGQVLRSARDPLVGQMRLTWWHGALSALDVTPPPAQPVLQALAAEVLPHGVTGADLAAMIDGWEALLEDGAVDLDGYAQARGAVLFAAAGRVIGADARDPVAAAGTGWALADLAQHVREPATATLAQTKAAVELQASARRRWSRAGRPLGALAVIARMDLALSPVVPPPLGAPRRVARLAWHRITGR